MQGRNKKKAAGLFFLLQSNQFSNNGMASDGQSDSSGDCRAFVLPVDVVIRSPEVLAEQRDDPCSFIHKVLEEGKVLYE